MLLFVQTSAAWHANCVLLPVSHSSMVLVRHFSWQTPISSPEVVTFLGCISWMHAHDIWKHIGILEQRTCYISCNTAAMLEHDNPWTSFIITSTHCCYISKNFRIHLDRIGAWYIKGRLCCRKNQKKCFFSIHRQ